MNSFENFTVNLINEKDNYPYELLLLADETVEAINMYVHDSSVYVVLNGDEQIAVFCLYEVDKNIVEIKKIAVSEKYQHTGIGSKLISHIKEICKNKYSTLIVGTADCGTAQIRFYERNGFQKYAVKENFFIDNYDVPIFENGHQLKDMVMFQCALHFSF